tara:strand:- start:797 stop:979 length:183 start_codon:yes stop_codon:yes gene_type:complete
MKSFVNDISKVKKTNVKLVQNRYKNLAYLIPLKKSYFPTNIVKAFVNKEVGRVFGIIREY